MRSTWDHLNFHTIRLTGHPMESLTQVQTYLHQRLSDSPLFEITPGTVVYSRSLKLVEGPNTFELDLPSPLEYNFKCFEIREHLVLPILELETLLEEFDRVFGYYYCYQNFTANELALLMKTCGFSGYRVRNQIVLFDNNFVQAIPE